jgi:hypothetical protein
MYQLAFFTKNYFKYLPFTVNFAFYNVNTGLQKTTSFIVWGIFQYANCIWLVTCRFILEVKG